MPKRFWKIYTFINLMTLRQAILYSIKKGKTRALNDISFGAKTFDRMPMNKEKVFIDFDTRLSNKADGGAQDSCNFCLSLFGLREKASEFKYTFHSIGYLYACSVC